jgi:hypothetical protein
MINCCTTIIVNSFMQLSNPIYAIRFKYSILIHDHYFVLYLCKLSPIINNSFDCSNVY